MSKNQSLTVGLGQQVGSGWEAPTLSVLTLRDAAKASESVIPTAEPSELPPPLMAKDIGDTDQPHGGSRQKPGGNADIGHAWT
jgi:hypothetical protein